MALTPEKAIENFKKLVDDFDCRVSQIFLANPETFLPSTRMSFLPDMVAGMPNFCNA